MSSSRIDHAQSLEYWQSIEASDDGMLGGVLSVEGFSQVSRIDLQGSRGFLAKLGIGTKNGRQKVSQALEGGAGIGRITGGLLSRIADHVDVIEPVTKFTLKLQDQPVVRHIFNVGLQDWQPLPNISYDMVWIQWCVGHLTDTQLAKHLQRCAEVLEPGNGVIIVKENISTGADDIFDSRDSSVTRTEASFQRIFGLAKLRAVRVWTQTGMPQSNAGKLFPVRMFALKSNVALVNSQV